MVLGVADIVMYEGWRVGIDHPLYARFNAALDCLVYLEADLATVRGWKKESSQRDAEREGMAWNEATAMKSWDTWIEPFVEKYELPLISQADIVISKSSTHRIRKCARGLVTRQNAAAVVLTLVGLLLGKEDRLREYFIGMCSPGASYASLGAVQGTATCFALLCQASPSSPLAC